jgi:Domain of unknown function (DUF1707)/2TM domain
MCFSTRTPTTVAQRTTGTSRRADGPRGWPTDPAARVGDAERDETVALLSDAAAEGYLRPEELDERLSAALTARTVADLRELTRDLPPEWQAERAGRAAAATAQQHARRTVRPRVAAYVRVMALLVVIWLAIGITAGAWYPWPVWPALGWGIALLAQLRAASGAVTDSKPWQPERVKIGT